MHLLIGIILVAAVVTLFLMQSPGAPRASINARFVQRPLNRSFAYLSNGLMFRRDANGTVQQLHSPFVDEAIRRQEKAASRHGWKAGTTFGVRAGGGMRNFDPATDKPFLSSSLAYDRNGDLLYFLKDDTVGGLFRLEQESGKELRLVLKQQFDLTDITPSPDGDKIAAASAQPNGTRNIALLDSDGDNYRELTGGDTLDSNPAWVPDDPNALLFQSIGLARNQEGYIIAQGNASIQMLDMASRNVTPILEDRDTDYLNPRVAPNGDLLFIRRPFDQPNYGYADSAVDTVLLPFRLLRALFHFLNFFSLMYSRKPLTSADNPGQQADVKEILLQGKRVDAEKALREGGKVQGIPSLVPANWELVAKTRHGDVQVLANHVCDFDVFEDGTIIYSNGQGVFSVHHDGTQGLVFSGELVAQVVAS
ncbi:hypothetical protein MWU49_08780 [Alcanivorax sp. S6407]|uniref:TolB family protein n=1 Tax=Alcanivorax sp. S6407 TaxID=2926424 RepID=UPI001FF4E946|nr:hypothetical protein [Alcanivorax sp. S6407]MCK0153795.1 hypothetical protein [Alcanivorax sp. S6407]